MEVQPRLPRAFSRLLLELQGQSLVHGLVGSPVLGGDASPSCWLFILKVVSLDLVYGLDP